MIQICYPFRRIRHTYVATLMDCDRPYEIVGYFPCRPLLKNSYEITLDLYLGIRSTTYK